MKSHLLYIYGMKKKILLFIFVFCVFSLNAQPPSFSWAYRHGHSGTNYSYISPAKNQGESGPCHVFASVAAVEAMAQIYYNKINANPGLNLSERLLYNDSGEGLLCEASDITNALTYFVNTGVIDEASFEFPGSSPWCRSESPPTTGNYNFRVTIPRFTPMTIGNDNDLKKAILDYGPLVVKLDGIHEGHYATYAFYGVDEPHSVLLLGWGESTNSWHIKDSWYGSPSISYFNINLFNYSPDFFRVDFDYNNEKIESAEGVCDYLIRDSNPVDDDNDGFYNWGMDSAPRPSGWPGTSLMDFDDSDSTTIFLYNYKKLEAPTISGPGYVCSGGASFTLNNVPSIMADSISWSVTYCTPSSGTGSTAKITPASYIGKNCKITFTIRYNGTVTYEKDFVINGPREDLVSMSVLDSYGGSPPGSGDMYYLCPNTTYNIFYYNYDNDCQTSNFVWDLPYGWTKHWDNGHVVSINTNDYPYGLLDVKANHCCEDVTPVKVYTLYFAEADCGEYFMAYPNPSTEFVDIDVVKDKISSEELVSDIKTYLSIIDKSGTVRSSTSFKGFPYRINTSDLPDGIYFMNIQFKDKISSIRLVIKH